MNLRLELNMDAEAEKHGDIVRVLYAKEVGWHGELANEWDMYVLAAMADGPLSYKELQSLNESVSPSLIDWTLQYLDILAEIDCRGAINWPKVKLSYFETSERGIRRLQANGIHFSEMTETKAQIRLRRAIVENRAFGQWLYNWGH